MLKKFLYFSYFVVILFGVIVLFFINSDFTKLEFQTTSPVQEQNDENRKSYSSETERNEELERITAQAIVQNNPEICEDLPVTGTYYHEGGLLNSYTVVHSTRYECLRRFARQLEDERACDIMTKQPDNSVGSIHSSSGCYAWVAETKNERLICEKIKNDLYKTNCIAVIEKNIDYCYKTQMDESDASMDSFWTSQCIIEVVKRTHEMDSCLKIDGPNYGEFWNRGRNRCLMIIAYETKRSGGSIEKICNLMIDRGEKQMVGRSRKEECYAGRVSGGNYRHLLPSKSGE